jgi:oligoribonuclease NrnB/cAMP/cGMP phosphodiesterase (DHH superfamily)
MDKFYDIVVFHYPCHDGLASAWITYMYHKLNGEDIELYPIQYNMKLYIDRLKSKNVLFCDYTPSNMELEILEKECNSIKILDHHISAKERTNKKYAFYDINRSGAGITWDYFFDKDRPNFINWIEDRDLWLWKYPESQKFHASFQLVLSTLEYNDFKNMFILFDELYNNSDNKISYYLNLGELINLSIQNKANNIACSHSKKINKYQNYNICIVNCPSDIISEVGSILTKDYNFDFIVLWRYNHPNKEYIVSLRANNKVNIANIAVKYGGGGHANAASFTTKINPLILFDAID